MINGYYLNKNFFSGLPQKQDVTFYLTDGGRDSGNVSRIKNVYLSLDYDNRQVVINVDNAYGGQPFIAEINVGNPEGISSVEKFLEEDVKEWLGYKNQWRKIPCEGKQFTFIAIENNEVIDIETFEGSN